MSPGFQNKIPWRWGCIFILFIYFIIILGKKYVCVLDDVHINM